MGSGHRSLRPAQVSPGSLCHWEVAPPRVVSGDREFPRLCLVTGVCSTSSELSPDAQRGPAARRPRGR